MRSRLSFNAIYAAGNRIAAIVLKEFFCTLRDKGARVILIVPVFVQAILFGYGATFNLERVPWVLLDNSHSFLSGEVIQATQATGLFSLQANVRSIEELTQAIDDGTALLGLYFPTDFARTGQVFLIADGRNSTTAGVASGYFAAITATVNARALRAAAAPITFVERYRWNENGITRYGIVPALVLALSMIQVLILAGLSVAREREEGSFDMMLMTPASSLEILIGKSVIPLAVACFQAFMIFIIGIFWFELPFSGAFFTLGVFVAGFALSFVGLGLAISALAGTIQQAFVAVIYVMMPALILSGLLTSVRAMPQWLQTVTLLNPLRNSVQALRAIYFEGASLWDIMPLFWPVAMTALLSMTIAAWLFRHKIS